MITSVSLFFNTSVLVTFIIALLWYIFNAIGFFSVAKRLGIKNYWLAWIPFIQYYLFGKIIGNKVLGIKHAGILLVCIPLIIVFYPVFIPLNITTFLIYLGIIIVFYIYYQAAFNEYYKIVDPNKAFLYFVLGILFPFLIPIWVLVLTKEPKDEYDQYYRE